MSEIKNEAVVVNNEKVNVLRGGIWTRATWMGLFYDEACKAGLAKEMEEVLRRGIRRLGLQQGGEMRQPMLDEDGNLDFAKFQNLLLPPVSFDTFEAEEIKADNDSAEVTYHFCPLLKGWQDQGFDDERCALLCDIAMEGDRCIAEGLGLDFELEQSIAQGCPTCHMIYRKKRGTK